MWLCKFLCDDQRYRELKSYALGLATHRRLASELGWRRLQRRDPQSFRAVRRVSRCTGAAKGRPRHSAEDGRPPGSVHAMVTKTCCRIRRRERTTRGAGWMHSSPWGRGA